MNNAKEKNMNNLIDENIKHNKYLKKLFMILIIIDLNIVGCLGFITWYLFSE